MIKRLLLGAVLFALSLAGPTLALQNEFADVVSCSDTNTAVSFGFAAMYVSIANDDATNEVFYTLTSDTATTSSPQLLAGESRQWTAEDREHAVSEVGIICSTAETASVRVEAWR